MDKLLQFGASSSQTPRALTDWLGFTNFNKWRFCLDWLEFLWSPDWAHKLILMILLTFLRGNFQKNSYVKGCSNCV